MNKASDVGIYSAPEIKEAVLQSRNIFSASSETGLGTTHEGYNMTEIIIS